MERKNSWSFLKTKYKASGNPNAKLNKKKVDLIRSLHMNNWRCMDIFRTFDLGVSYHTIYYVIKNKTWVL